MKKIFSILLTMLLLCGCATSKTSYFEDLNQQAGSLGGLDYEIRIEPGDELLITVTSEVPEATLIYNLPMTNPATKSTLEYPLSSLQQQTYTVDKEGNLNFPVLGKIQVKGMTTKAIQEELTRRIAQDVEAPFVRVELINFKVKVIGEVLKPGSVLVEGERISILDALAEVGDMTIYGQRDNVLLIREENGIKNYYRIDMTKSDILESPYFYLKQNDVIYVQPSKGKAGQADFNQNNTYKVSIVSAIISGVSVIASLLIATGIIKK